jgi:hypothetical protein
LNFHVIEDVSDLLETNYESETEESELILDDRTTSNNNARLIVIGAYHKFNDKSDICSSKENLLSIDDKTLDEHKLENLNKYQCRKPIKKSFLPNNSCKF